MKRVTCALVVAIACAASVVGTVIALGTPTPANLARPLGRYLRARDVNVCSYEGVGTLTNPVVDEGK